VPTHLPSTSLPGPSLASTFFAGASPLATHTAYLPRRILRPVDAHHIGFLNYNRRLLAMGAVVACGALTSIPSLPASAEVLHEETTASQLQAFATPGSFYVDQPERDTFVVSSFSLVQWPVPSTTTMSDGFGFRSCVGCSSDHKGIDLTPGEGYPIEAVADGVVSEALSDSDGLGVHVIVRHVIDGQVFSSLYAHLLVGSMTVRVGDTVTRGQILGNVGDTGSSTGPHLHFGILGADNIEIDTEAWLHAHANSPLV
jgi:murein DD-endopeptidase MepM/ murein hydrolase activator NlpD